MDVRRASVEPEKGHSMYHLRSLGLAMAMLATPAYASDLTQGEFEAIAEQVFRPVIDQFSIPGIAFGVTLNGQQFFFTDGLADRQASRPVDTDTLFELGSVSKLFNVALAGLGEAQGRLSLASAVSDERPALAGSAFDQITLYDLAAHANGGLPLQVPDDITDNTSLMRYLSRWNPDVDTRALRSYSNVSIGLLGQIVADRFGGTYENAVTEYLLPGLGLNSTFVTVPEEALAHYAYGYTRTDDRPVRVNSGLLGAEAYGITSNVADMTRFLDAHLGNLRLSDELTRALAITRVSEFDTAHYAQAMVWEGYPWPVDRAQVDAGNSYEMAMQPQAMTHREPEALEGPVFLNKTGSTNGFGAYVAMVPSENIGVVVLANRNYPNPARADVTLRLITELLAATDP